MKNINGQTFTLSVNGIEETQGLADQMSKMIRQELKQIKCLTICLTGTLGAGKTTFIRYLATALGVDENDVSSPTFSLHQQYVAQENLLINHFDFYRFDDEDQIFEVGFEETVAQPGLHLVEWGEKFAVCLPDLFWSLRIEVLGETARNFTLKK